MELARISEIREVHSPGDDVNRWLKAGWVLLSVSSGTKTVPDGEEGYFIYSVGLPNRDQDGEDLP